MISSPPHPFPSLPFLLITSLLLFLLLYSILFTLLFSSFLFYFPLSYHPFSFSLSYPRFAAIASKDITSHHADKLEKAFEKDNSVRELLKKQKEALDAKMKEIGGNSAKEAKDLHDATKEHLKTVREMQEAQTKLNLNAEATR